jgi:glycosyltransferase involved in cell wall biosynthesis
MGKLLFEILHLFFNSSNFAHMVFLPWIALGVFGIVLLVQLYFYLRYFRLLAFYKKQEDINRREHPVSVVICARDEADQIEANLPGVLAQSYKSTHEIVIVNDNSQDDTKYLLDGLYKDFKQLHIIELKQEAVHIPGKKFPLSVGIKSAKHELILLTDADCIPSSEHWISKMQNGFSEGIDIVLGYGGYKKAKGLLNKIIRFDTFHTALQYLSFALGGRPYMGVGRNLAYKRQLFFKQKGFASHHHLPGGDDDLFINGCAHKHNTAVVVDKDAFTLSTPAKKWSEWISQKERHNATGKYYKGSDRLMLAIYMMTHILFFPALVFAFLFLPWVWVLPALAVKLLIQGIVFYRCMVKLNEKDLFPYFILWDIWMIFYYTFFLSSLWKKPRTNWN